MGVRTVTLISLSSSNTVGSRHAEIVKLYEALGDLRVPADILVYSEQEIEEWGHLAGSTMYEALVESKVLYDAA
jgi:hypothetical protein